MKILLSVAAIATALGMSAVLAEIKRHDFNVQSEPGIQLQVREVSDAQAAAGKPPVILLHGARVPGVASFDLPVDGGSLAADLARAGHRVFVMDARGYGGSTRIGQDGARQGAPLVNSNEVVRDIHAVVGATKERTAASEVALLGWATGGHWAGMYASLYPDAVNHVVIYNALYGAHEGHEHLGRGTFMSDPNDPNRFNTERFGTYRLNTADSLLPSWDRAIPVEDKTAWRDPEVAAAYQQAALASDPTAQRRNPPSFRAPSGAMEDSFYLALGRQLWDAASITGRVLIIRSENDFWSRPEDMIMLQNHLINAAEVEAITIPNATHHVHLDRGERGRDAFLQAVTAFLSR
ncbi:alpha/beta hydrolase [Exilibacterium tricleocarpae]|uniref:Alpha/beta hydrolase n=1 Tax=Exilibacterium tricleocarpae TaxID=2591008 RepID=A0A545T0N9_9GAMM|nr:alpha/beta hydrolase [Exilibacterium tricleocarpae]TQV70749.1 alpha/beta hydrolase [Exilibacterium tricleocarpae]